MNESRFVHYKLGIPEIDEQHWELFQLLEEAKRAEALEVNTLERDDISASHLIGRKFMEKLAEHEQFETELMTKCSYPFSHEPELGHRGCILAVNKQRKSDKLCPYRCATIADILAQHIDFHDFQYVPYYKKWLLDSNLSCSGAAADTQINNPSD